MKAPLLLTATLLAAVTILGASAYADAPDPTDTATPAGTPAPAGTPSVTFSEASVTHGPVNKDCESVYTFKMTIKATGFPPKAYRKDIEYRWIRSDMGGFATHIVEADADGTVTVHAKDSYRFSDQGRYWQAIQVQYPQFVTSPYLEMVNPCGKKVAPGWVGRAPSPTPSPALATK